MTIVDDLRTRLADRVQLITGGHRAYLEAVAGASGGDVGYAQLVKLYGATIGAPGRYSPAKYTGIKEIRCKGEPDTAHVSTSHVERQNLTMRMSLAMAAGVTDRLWWLEDVIARIDADAPAPAKRGAYRKRENAA